LRGVHQGKNAAVAAAAAVQLSRNWRPLQKSKIIQGIESTRWEGRLETVARHPMILLDGAHNVEGARVLRKYAAEFLKLPLTLVFAVMRDKEISALADILFPLADKILVTRFPYYRAATPKEIIQKSLKYRPRLHIAADPETALQQAVRFAGRDGVVLVAGSLFLVGEIKKLF